MADEDPNEIQEQETEQQEFESADQMLPAYLQQGKFTIDDFKKHISGPVLSIVLHIILFAVVGTAIITEPPPKETPEVVVEMKEVEVVPPPPPPPPEIQPQEEVQVENFTDVPMERPSVQTEAISLSESVSDVQTGNSQTDVSIPTMVAAPLSHSALKMPGLMQSRSAGGIKSSLKRYGGSARGEKSVNDALRWLAKVQNEDGSWGERNTPQVAITAVATLAFLAHGETPQSADFGETVLKALKRLAGWADSAPADRTYAGNGYAHAMMTYALSEGYAMTRIPMLERAMDKMANTIVQGQNPMGGYDYNFAKNPLRIDPKTGKLSGQGKVGDYRCDLSLAGWCYQALKAAYAGGCTVDGLHEAIERGAKCIRTTNCPGKTGGFSYVNGSGPTLSMTSVGTLCLQLFGQGRTAEARNGMKWIEAFKPGGNPEKMLEMDWKAACAGAYSGSMPLYTWYYMTQAMFQGYSGDGKPWDKWNKSFRSVLTKEQDREGFWDSPHAKYRKPTKDKDGKETTYEALEGSFSFGTQLGQRVWSTSLCTLMLEVYYRFLPTFKTVEAAPAAGGGSSSDEEESGEEDLSL